MSEDRIRVWNAETREMMEPATIQELLHFERNVHIEKGWVYTSEEPLAPDILYGHLVFMWNTGIFAQPRKELAYSSNEELFAEDLIVHSIEPYVYRVVQEDGCWCAESLFPAYAQSRLLKHIFKPRLVGNVFENRELFEKGEIDD